MDIKLYTTSDKPNTINKKKTDVKTITGNAITPLDVISPVIMVKIDNAIFNANYVYIDKFKRYYFIKTITVDNGFMNLTLAVDPLESFKADILAYNGIIERQEYDYNLYLVDDEISAYTKNIVTYKKFPNTPFSANLVDAREKRFLMITTSD